MPVYEYQCKACSREFEYQQRMSDPDKTLCEACGEEKLERLISRTAFQLKGSGWYKDLYSSSKPAEKPAGDGAPKSDAPAADKAATPAAAPASTPAPAASSGSTSSTSSTPSTSGTSGTGSSGSSGSGGSGAKSAARKMPAT